MPGFVLYMTIASASIVCSRQCSCSVLCFQMGHATAEAVVRAGLQLVPRSFTGESEGVAVDNIGRLHLLLHMHAGSFADFHTAPVLAHVAAAHQHIDCKQAAGGLATNMSNTTGVAGIPVELILPDARQQAMEEVKRAFPGVLIIDFTLPSAVNGERSYACVRARTPFLWTCQWPPRYTLRCCQCTW